MASGDLSDKFLKNAIKQKACRRFMQMDRGDSYFASLLQDWEGIKEMLKQNVAIAVKKLCKASVLCRRS